MRTKVVVFDFDGTLTLSNQNSWARIWKEINALDVDKKYYDMYMAGDIDYDRWLEICFEEYKARGVNKPLLQKVAKQSIKINHLEEVFKYLNSRGISIYILSGGIDNTIRYILGDLIAYVKELDANVFVFDGDEMVNFIPSNGDRCLKHNKINEILTKENVKPDELLFVGNGKNDETAYKSKARTLCLNADDTDPNNKTIWHNSITTDDLMDILKFID